MWKRTTMMAAMAFSCLTAHASEWTSPNGAVAVQVPSPTHFDEIDSSPDLIKHWQSKDQMVQLSIVEDDWTLDRAIRRGPLVQGFLREFDAQLISSSVDRIKGNDVFVMTGIAEASGRKVYAKQIVVHVDNKVYKFLAMTSARDIEDVPDVGSFFDSVKVLKSSAKISKTSFPSSTGVPQGSPEEAAGAIGELVGFLAIPILVTIWFFRRTRKAAAA